MKTAIALVATALFAGSLIGCKSDRPYGTPKKPSPYSMQDASPDADALTAERRVRDAIDPRG